MRNLFKKSYDTLGCWTPRMKNFRNFKGVIRYILISTLCLSLHIIIINTGYNYKYGVIFPNALSFFVTAIVGFVFHSRWTFSSHLTWAGFMHYTVAMSLNLPISIGLLWIGIHFLKQPIFFCSLISTIIMVVWNYLNSRIAALRYSGNGAMDLKCYNSSTIFSIIRDKA